MNVTHVCLLVSWAVFLVLLLFTGFYHQQHPTLAKSTMCHQPGPPAQRKQVKVQRTVLIKSYWPAGRLPHYNLSPTLDHKALKTMDSGEMEFSRESHARRERLKPASHPGKPRLLERDPLSSDLSDHPQERVALSQRPVSHQQCRTP